MYQNYIFDFYGTLADIRTDEENPYLWEKISEIYSALGAGYEAEELRRTFRRLEEQERERISREAGENAEPDLTKVFAMLYHEKKVPCDAGRARMTAVTFRALSREYLRVYDGVKEFLALLRRRGKGVYLLSNAQTDFTRPEIEMLGLTPCFDGIFISAEQGCKKPSPVFFERLLKRFGLDSAESIMIGNDLSADIAGACAVGMDSLYIHTEISPGGDADLLAEDGKSEKQPACSLPPGVGPSGRILPTYRVMDGDFRKIKGLVLGGEQ